MNVLYPRNAKCLKIHRQSGTGDAGNPLDERLLPVITATGNKIWEGNADALVVKRNRYLWSPENGSSKVQELTVTIPNLAGYKPVPDDILHIRYPASNTVTETYIVSDIQDVVADSISTRGYVLSIKLKNTI